MKQAIVIQTHYSNVKMLEDLLISLNGVQYPIKIVANDSDNAPVNHTFNLYNVLDNTHILDSTDVQILLAFKNGYDPQVIQVIYEQTDYDEFLLLHDTMIIKRLDLFDLFFKTHAGMSVSFFHNYMNFIGKFVRNHLTNFYYPVVCCKWGAVMAELNWGPQYTRNSNAITLFPDLYHESTMFQEIDGKQVMVIENEYFRKYKHNWNLDMVSNDRIW